MNISKEFTPTTSLKICLSNFSFKFKQKNFFHFFFNKNFLMIFDDSVEIAAMFTFAIRVYRMSSKAFDPTSI